MPKDARAPFVLLFVLCPIVIFYSRYAATILSISFIWAYCYLKKTWTPITVLSILQKQVMPTNRMERYLNYGLVVVGFFDLFRPYGDHVIEFRMLLLLMAGFVWWQSVVYLKAMAYLRAALFCGVLVASMIILIDYFCGNLWLSLHPDKSPASLFSIIAMTISTVIWPIMARQSFWKTALFSLLIIIIMPILDCDTAVIGVIFGLICYGLGSIQAKLFWRFIQVKIVVICIALPFFFNTFMTNELILDINRSAPIFSYIHRLYIWQFTSHKIMERPLIGFGINASLKTDVGAEHVTWEFFERRQNEKDLVKTEFMSRQINFHPHNAILQWWLEMGLIGVLWWSALLVFIIEKIRCLPLRARRITFAFFAANMMIILVSIGFWQTWWWATWLLLVPFVAADRDEEEHQ